MKVRILAIVSLSILIAGCGATEVVTVVTASPQVTTVPRAHVSRPARVTVTSGLAVGLPASPHQTQCQVSAGSAQIIFYSRPLQVARLCQAQIKVGAWRSGYQTETPGAQSLLVCYLYTADATVVASVFDTETGTAGLKACDGLIATHDWFDAQTHATTCRSADGSTLKEPPGTRCE